jgi:hypothetical protein
MSTTYDETPSILERVIGSDLILVGITRGPVRVDPLETSETRRVHGWFEVSPQEILAGAPTPTVLLRVLGEGRDEHAAWVAPVPSENQMLLMLTRDIGPDLPDNLFAPCFNSIFELAADGTVQVPPDTVDEATREAIGSAGERLTIDGLRRVIETVQQRRDAVGRRLEEAEPPEVRHEPRPELLEYPQSALDRAEAAQSPGGGTTAELN